MTQKLFIEIAEANGQRTQQEVHVIRSWQQADGSHIFLFANGSYCFRNGAPVRSLADLAVITSPVQHRAAEAWWIRSGEALSKSYYAAVEERERRIAGDFQVDGGAMSDSDLDAVLYLRTSAFEPSAQREGPFSWMDLFQKRPDWWGQANVITFEDWTYQRLAEARQDIAAGKPLPQGNETAPAGDKSIKPAGKR
jgi:hypothetical protein